MNEASSVQPEFPVTQAEFDAASANLDKLTQTTEIGIRRELARLDDLFERITNEVVARLNEEKAEPDEREIAKVVQRVFEKYFGRSVRVRIEEGPEEDSFRFTTVFNREGEESD